MKPWSSFPPNMSTTARGLSFSITSRTCVNQLKTSGRSSPLAMRPSIAFDGIDRSVAGDGAEERLARDDDERVAGDPHAQLALRRELRRAARASPASSRVGVVAGGCGGATTAVSTSSSSSRPSAALSPRRGRSRKRAPLTLSSGPVAARATSRFQPSGWIVADLCRPGAFRKSANASPTSETTIADPAECRRRPPSAVRGRGPAAGRVASLHQNWK